MSKKLAVIGASYLQVPLIKKAESMGIETYAFAWADGAVGAEFATKFYPVSIVEKDEILKICREIGIDGICTIASDLAAVTVNYVADKMNLIGNSPECAVLSTNKNAMRRAFSENGDPSPKSVLVHSADELDATEFDYPIIVKPVDRSGSRGITKLYSAEGLYEAVENAKAQGFEKSALVEEFAEGTEYSVEYISWEGEHTFLAITRKFTTGSPHFIETGHLEPAPLSAEMTEKIKKIIPHALDSLKIKYGASHSEIKIDKSGNVKIIEIGGRMGGDRIGSDLVSLSTGIDFTRAVIETALGIKPSLKRETEPKAAGIRFVFSKEDADVFARLKSEHPEYIVDSEISEITDREVTDSSSRFGDFLMSAESADELLPYLPKDGID